MAGVLKKMKVIEKFILMFRPVVQIANNAGGIVFAIWLAVRGEWLLIVLGVLAALGCNIVLKYALMLQGLFMLPMSVAVRKGVRAPIYLLVFLSQAYAAVLMTGWCLVVFVYAFNLSLSRPDAIIPILGWSYGVAMAPWAYLVWHETGVSGEPPPSFILVFFACLASIVMVVTFLIGGGTIYAYIPFFILMILGLLSQYLISLDGITAIPLSD